MRHELETLDKTAAYRRFEASNPRPNMPVDNEHNDMPADLPAGLNLNRIHGK
jgi:hypothetical protein